MPFSMRAQIGALLAVFGLYGPAGAAPLDFFGVWTNGDADTSGIARVVVSFGESQHAGIRLFIKCPPNDCDWGMQPARYYADDPASHDIRTLAADFTAGGTHRHLVLHLVPGAALRFDVQTDFTDSQGGNNFATSGILQRTGGWRDALDAAVAPPHGAPAASPDVQPMAATPPSSSGGWFGGSNSGQSGIVGFGAALPPGYVPSKWEECTPFNPDQVRAALVDGGWRVGDFSHRLLNFDSSREAAQHALAVLAAYHFDEECFVTKSGVQMLYFKRAGLVPKSEMPNEDCDVLDPATVKAIAADGTWTVVAGGRRLFDFDDDKAAADRAVSVIRTYKLTRQCFFARGHQKAQYWLAQ